MSADAQAIIAALSQQISGVNQNIAGLATRVDNQFAILERRLNGPGKRCRALAERLAGVEVAGGSCAAASSAGSAPTALGAASVHGSTAWANFRHNIGATNTDPYFASRPREDSIEADYLKTVKKRRLIRIGGLPEHGQRRDHSVVG